MKLIGHRQSNEADAVQSCAAVFERMSIHALLFDSGLHEIEICDLVVKLC